MTVRAVIHICLAKQKFFSLCKVTLFDRFLFFHHVSSSFLIVKQDLRYAMRISSNRNNQIQYNVHWYTDNFFESLGIYIPLTELV